MTRLEAKSEQASKKVIVVGDEAESDALARAGYCVTREGSAEGVRLLEAMRCFADAHCGMAL